MKTKTVTQRAGEEHGLADMFRAWGLPPNLIPGSDRWRAELVPYAADDDELLGHVVAGTPATCNVLHASKIHSTVGEDGIEYLTSGPWNDFGRPKIAFVGGWGEPGQMAVDETSLKLVKSFADVINDGDHPLNLQMFHRPPDGSSSRGGNGQDYQPPAAEVPVLPDLLEWPLPRFFAAGGEDSGPTAIGGTLGTDAKPAVLCDRATRLSRKHAVTWWHLDDCGEFVFQAGLPMAPSKATRQKPPVLLGPGGKPAIKIFIFAPKEAYDLIAQDEVANNSGCFAGLHLFSTPSKYLPGGERGQMGAGSTGGGGGGTGNSDGSSSSNGGGGGALPKFKVAVLEAGGRPLLSPPNVPHMVITLETCVMVEQRKISKLILDEVLYFKCRMARWADPPIMYPFVKDTCQDPKLTKNAVVQVLESALKESVAKDSPTPLDHAIATRAWQSLHAVRENPEVFAASEETRSNITTVLDAAVRSGQPTRDQRSLKQTEIIRSMATSDPGVVRLGHNLYAGYVHVDGQPRWGPFRPTPMEAMADKNEMGQHLKSLEDLDPVLHGLYTGGSGSGSGGGGGGGSGGDCGDDGCDEDGKERGAKVPAASVAASPAVPATSTGVVLPIAAPVPAGGGGGAASVSERVEIVASSVVPTAAVASKPPTPKATVAPKAEVSTAHSEFDFFD